ncbi:hypothetical protein WR25_06654 [Diploscapter pachys]|uniref:RING-type E3 ubiquitin transferase n=1 Tax=Diploscapter pachys TaxID=2018661 RepID=A0A2A2JUG9_9BILA|nr:hypothetical protein WR25_06654 [Diploscapter pachys]
MGPNTQMPQSSSSSNAQGGDGNGDERKDDNSRFECNICLDTARDAVVSLCGHLFCWPCLVQWLDTRPNRQLCPVCKSAIDKDKVIPIYGRGGDNKDPREKIPPRPQGQRSEASSGGFPGFQWGDGNGNVQFSLGIGIFPFTMFSSLFTFGGERQGPDGQPQVDPNSAQPGSRQHQEEQFLSNTFMAIGFLFLFWLLTL